MTDAVTAKLAEWGALTEAATGGEWSWIHDTRVSGERVCRIGSLPGNYDVGWTPRGNGEADAEFIAAARHMVPALLAFVREVRAGHVREPYVDEPSEGFCRNCQRGGAAGTWPCPTEQAAQKWIGGEG